jgi:ribosomal protein S20
MKKLTYVFLGIFGIVLLSAGIVFAQNYMMGVSPDELASKQQTMFQQTANILGISIDDVKNAWADGKTISQIAQDHNISQDQLQQKMKDYATQQMNSEMQTLVSKGVINQDQANRRMQTMQSKMSQMMGGMMDGMMK